MKPDRSAEVESGEAHSEHSPKPPSQPDSRPTTNLLIADIVLSAASGLLHKDVNRRVSAAEREPSNNARAVDGRTILTTLALYSASKIATRSVPGLALVAGGLVLKALYDRGKARELAGESDD